MRGGQDMYGINNIRFGGIASGLDTESIVKQLMRIEQTKLDRINQQKTLLEWKREDYRSINNQLRSFREGANWNLRLQSTFMAKTVTTTNDTIFNVTANNKAAPGNYTFEVKQLAKGVTVEGKLDKENVKSIEGFFEENNLSEVTFKINGHEIVISQGDSYQNVVDKINELSDKTGVKAIYEPGLDRFFLYTENTGSQAQIKVSDDSGFLSGVLGLSDSDGNDINNEALLGIGSNAIMMFNDIELEFASNKFEFIGLNFDLKKAAEGEIVHVQVNNNIDKIVDDIKAFVEAYNKIIDDIGTKLNEKRYRDYPPLTEEQKAEMKEKDIEKWEEKARSGIFRADPLLSQISSTMRMTVTDAVGGLEGKYKTLSSIGIMTSPDWKDNGKLYIDEDKLRKALAEDLEGVAKIFNNEDTDPKNQGIAVKLDSQIRGFYEQIASTAGRPTSIVDESYLGKEIKGLDERIETLQNKMYLLEEKYWRQFTAMEKALAQMQAQSDWLYAQLSGGQW